MSLYRLERTISFVLVLAMLFGILTPYTKVHAAEDVSAGDMLSISAEDFTGKQISILGDSISTFSGVSNSSSYNSTIGSNAVYYSSGTLGVYRDDTWWQQAIDTLGMELLVNNSWSGSTVFYPRMGESSVGYGERCVNLHNDTTGEKPDVIVVFLGTNDFSYYQSTLGTADIAYDVLITDDGYATPTTTCEAYAIMLDKMIARYPDAEIYCMGMTARRSPDKEDSYADVGQPTAFNAELKKIVDHFGVTYVDLENCGIDADAEVFDTYMGDGRVHPNALGMDKITEALVSAMRGQDTKLYSVSYSLSGVSCNQNSKIALSGESYTANLTLSNSYTSMDVAVTMGGEDVTADCYSNGEISILEVTGDIAVTATGTLNKQPENYRWEFDGSGLVSTGEDDNALTKQAGTFTDGVFNGVQYSLNTPILLTHDAEWIVEWKGCGDWSGMLLTSTAQSGTTGMNFLFRTYNATGLLAFGEYSGQYNNYGIALADLGLDMTESHTYRIENRIADDGSNMAYLIIDGTEIGAMNNYFIAGTNDQNKTVNWICGKDFVFSCIGSSSHPIKNISLEYLQIWERGECTELDAFEYTLDQDNKTITLDKYIGADATVIVPSYYFVDAVRYKTLLQSETVFCGNTTITSVTIGRDVGFVENTMYKLFESCSQLVSVDMTGIDTSEITSMREVFSLCRKLTSISGLESWNTCCVQSIFKMFNQVARYAEGPIHCIDLRDWNLSEVTNSGWCFQYCLAEQILLPDTLKTMSAGIFNHALKIAGTSYTIPAGIEKIGYAHTFYDFATSDFTEFIVADGNEHYVAIDGILYSADGTEMLAVPRNKTFENNTFEIPEGVNFLGELSFSRNYNINTLILPDSYVIEYVPLNDSRYIVYEDIGNINAGTNLSIAIYCYTGITEYAVKDNNPNYTSLNGIIYSKDMTEVVAIPARYAQEIVIPDGVTVWNKEAMWADFDNNSQNTLTSLLANCPGVTIPASLKEISEDQLAMLNLLYNNRVGTSNPFTITLAENNPNLEVDESGNLVIVAHEHSYESTITAPTCTEQGYTTYTCECGDSYVSDYVEATGHSYENGACIDCGEEEPLIAAGWYAVPISTTEVSETLAYQIVDGVLIFRDFGDSAAEGFGMMPSYTNSSVVETKYNITPWYQARAGITKVVFDATITYVGSYVLTNMDSVAEIHIENPNAELAKNMVLFSTTTREEPLLIYAATTMKTVDSWIRGSGNRKISEAISDVVLYYTDLEHLAMELEALETALKADEDVDSVMLWQALRVLENIPHYDYSLSDYRCAISGAEDVLELLWELSTGSCGENLNYRLSAGEQEYLLMLDITGSGDMTQYQSPEQAPWYDVLDCISDVTVDDLVTGLSVSVLPEGAVYHIHLNSEIYAIASKNEWSIEIDTLRVLLIGNSHTANYSEFRANILSDLKDAGLETEIGISRSIIGSIGLYSGRNSNANAVYRSQLEAIQNGAGAFSELKNNRYDLVIIQDYMESIIDEPEVLAAGLAEVISQIKAIVSENGQGSPEIAWFADWVDIRATGGDNALYDGDGNKISLPVRTRQEVYAHSLENIDYIESAIEQGTENMPDFVIHGVTIKQNAMSSYLGTTKLFDKDSYCVLEMDTTHMTYELGRYLMGAGVFEELLGHYRDVLIMSDLNMTVADSLTIGNGPVADGTGSQFEGSMNEEVLAIVREAISSPNEFQQSVYVVDPVDTCTDALFSIVWDTASVTDEASALALAVDEIGKAVGVKLDELEVQLATYADENNFSVTVRMRHGYSIRQSKLVVHTHTYSAVVTAPTCTEQGYTTYTCSTCGDSYVADYVDAAHRFSPWIEDANEETYRNCLNCDYTETSNVTVAKVGESEYFTLSDAIQAASTINGTVALQTDLQITGAFLPSGVTLDLGEFALTADYLIGLKGSYLTATPNAGKLMIDKDGLFLSGEGYKNASGQSILPIWDPNQNCYLFSLFVLNTDSQQKRGLTIDEENEQIYFQFKHQATRAINQTLLKDGSSDNALEIIVRLVWTTDNGEAYQDFVYNNAFVGKVSGSYDYTFTLNGYSAMSINLDTLSVTAMILTDSGATASSVVWTAESAN